MTNTNLALKAATRRFGNQPRGKYPHLIRQFLNSGEAEMAVDYDDLQNAYLGLRAAISNMGLRNSVTARRQGADLHLIRLR